MAEHELPDAQNAPLLLTLAAAALILIAAEVTYPPPEVIPATAGPSEFSAARALELLESLVGDHIPHPAGTEQNHVVRQRISDQLAAWGHETIKQNTQAERNNGRVIPLVNLMVRIPGTDGSPAVMMTCHHDSAPQAPGAGDDGAAVAATLEVVRMLADHPPMKRDLILLITDGEEFGLLGAEQFVAEHPWADDVAVVLNFEGRGSSGPSLMFETSPQNEALVRLYAWHTPHPRTSSLFCEVYKYLPNDTDFTIFKQAGIPGLNFAFIGNVKNYHTPQDTIDMLDPRSMQHHGENAWAMVTVLGDLEPTEIRADDNAVYFDLFGQFVVYWPQRFSVPFALLALATTFVGVARLLTHLPPRRLHPALWACPLSFVAVATTTAALLFGLSSSALLEFGWPERAGAINLGVASGATLALVAAAYLVPPGCGSAVTAGCWVSLGMLGLAVAVLLPGGCYFFVLPLLAGGAAAVVLAKSNYPALTGAVWSISFLALCLPVERLYYDAVGFTSPMLVAVRFGLLGIVMFPMIVMATHRCRLALTATATLAFVGSLLWAAAV